MADSASRADRAKALEDRKRRLEELKKRRKGREADTAKVKAAASANLDDYIDGLLRQPGAAEAAGDPRTNQTAAVGTTAPVPQQSKINSAATTPNATPQTSSLSSSQVNADNVIAERAPAAPPPKVVETFTISTQTDEGDFPQPEEVEQEDEEADQDREKQSDGGKDQEAGAAANAPIPEDEDPKLLSAEEIEREVQSTPFSSFITTASKKVERMLGTPLLSDLLVDYASETDGADRSDNDKGESSSDAANRYVSSRQVYEYSKWTAGRDVTDLDWSPLHRELILSTYHMPSSAFPVSATAQPLGKGSAAVSAVSPNDTSSSTLTPRSGELQSDGLAAVWNLTMPSRPEHVFTCGSPVTTGCFHPTESTLIIGGCESGQLVVWDIRAGRLPVQKSALASVAGASSKGHIHPICGMEVIERGSGLATASSDGRVNFWSLGNLREPVESYQVSDSVSCFAIVPETEALLLGDENGSLYTLQSAGQSASGGGQRSSRKKVRKLDATDADGETAGHFGMVTSLSTKILKKGASSVLNRGYSQGSSKGFLRGSSGLVLSSGVDWTVKLWAPAYSDTPLTSLVSHSYDYMSDVQWSPVNPALFATATSNGTVGLWDLASSLEEPLTGSDGILVEPEADAGSSSARGLNRLKWSSDGRRMAVAAADRVHVLSLPEDVARPKGDEESKVMNQLISRGLISRQ